MIPLLAAGVLSPFFFEATPEVRSTYQSLGKIVEDRPMQMTSLRGGFDAGDFGRFGVRNWDVSSLTGRRSDAHRHALYHSELGLTWQRDIEIADGWRLRNDLTRSWTMYRGFGDGGSNRTYHWYQIDQSLENPYVVPFWRIRKCFRGSDYLYFKAGLRRRFEIRDGISVTPSVFAARRISTGAAFFPLAEITTKRSPAFTQCRRYVSAAMPDIFSMRLDFAAPSWSIRSSSRSGETHASPPAR